MAKQTAVKKQKSFEETLWDTANQLRGSIESSEYKHVVLSLIFLKFISDKFEERKLELIAEGKEKYVDMVEFYTMRNVFYLPEQSRWSFIQENSKQNDIAIKIDTALSTVEKSNKSLKGALPDNYFSRLGLDSSKLASLIDTVNNIDTVEDREEDVVGRVYEYCLGKFAASEGKRGGEFYTPSCIVNLIAEMLEPYKGTIYDPCCGSGGMFVQSVKFVESHRGDKREISIFGQEYTATTYKLAKMNLAIRGISGNLGDIPADTFFKDQHPSLKADFIMANPPFNQKQWRAEDELTDDSRWAGYNVPPTGNANYAWIMHMISKLSANGVAGFVLANGSMSSNTSGEGQLRQKIIENDLVDCMIALPGQLFYTTQIPVCLWFLAKNKAGGQSPSPLAPLPKGEGKGHFRGGFDFSGLVQTARELRKKQTPAEDVVWELLRNRNLMNLKFRRQHQIGDYVVDFYCPDHKLVVELDGAVHDTKDRQTVDRKRDGYLKSIGCNVLRFENKEVIENPDVFLSRLLSEIERLAPLPLGEAGVRANNTLRDRRGEAPLPLGEAGVRVNNTLRDRRGEAPLPLGEAGVRVNRTRDRRGEVLFIDARQMGTMVDRVHKEITADDIRKIADTYHSWRGESDCGEYSDEAGYCKSAKLDEIAKHDYVLTPGRYVGAADIEDDGIAFETKMEELSQTLYKQMKESQELDAVIRKNLEGLGYGEYY